MKKKIIFKPKPLITSKIPEEIEAKIDEWIANSESRPQKNQEQKDNPSRAHLEPIETKKEVRINFNIDQKLHKDLKLMCVQKGTSIKDLCAELLINELKKYTQKE